MSEVGAVGPVMFTNGTFGSQTSVMDATLRAVAEQQDIARRPLKVPDVSKFSVGRIVNIQA